MREHFKLHLTCSETHKASENNEPFHGVFFFFFGIHRGRETEQEHKYLHERLVFKPCRHFPAQASFNTVQHML